MSRERRFGLGFITPLITLTFSRDETILRWIRVTDSATAPTAWHWRHPWYNRLELSSDADGIKGKIRFLFQFEWDE